MIPLYWLLPSINTRNFNDWFQWLITCIVFYCLIQKLLLALPVIMSKNLYFWYLILLNSEFFLTFEPRNFSQNTQSTRLIQFLIKVTRSYSVLVKDNILTTSILFTLKLRLISLNFVKVSFLIFNYSFGKSTGKYFSS